MIAVIISSVLDLSGAMDGALESQAGIAFSQTGSSDLLTWISKGELIAASGLEVVEGEAKRKVASQVESIARLASGADEAYAEIGFTSQGDIRSIHVTLRNVITVALETSRDDSDRIGAYPSGEPQGTCRPHGGASNQSNTGFLRFSF